MDHEIYMLPPGAVLEAYHQDPERCVFIMGPLGSAKTFQTCQKILNRMASQEPNADGIRPSRWFAVRNTNPDLETTTIRDWLSLWGELGTFTNGAPPVHKIHFALPDGTEVKSEMIFMALDRHDAVKKLRGTQATGFWLNEAKELPKAIVDMADLRHGRYPTLADGGVDCTWHGMVGDTNAPDTDHWYYRMAEEEHTPGWSFHRQPGGLIPDGEDFRENPNAENLENLPEGYYIRGMVGKSRDWILVNLCNEYGFVTDAKPVYPEYVDGTHTAKKELEFDADLILYIGLDFGRTPAALFAQRHTDGQWQVIDELVTEDTSALAFGKELKRKLQKDFRGLEELEIWGDPSADYPGEQIEETAMDILRAQGLQVQACDTNVFTMRREAVVAQLLSLTATGRPGLVVSPRARMFRKGMLGGYQYKRVQVVGDSRFHDKPLKNIYSHICEAGQYLLLGAGEGDALTVRDIPNRVIHVNRHQLRRRFSP